MYSVLLLGAGGQAFRSDIPGSGNEHKVISFAKAFTKHPEFKIEMICDPDPVKLWDAMNILGIAGTGSIEYALSDYHKYDVIAIATPDPTHYEILRHIARMKQKPRLVICEKPLCMEVSECEEIIKSFKELGIGLLVDYTRRFIPELQQLRDDYRNGKLGKLLFSNCYFNMGAAHTGSHLCDFLRWIEPHPHNPHRVAHFAYEDDARIWLIDMEFERYHFIESRFEGQKVPVYFDHHMKYVVQNAYGYLQGTEELKCTGHDAVVALMMAKLLDKR